MKTLRVLLGNVPSVKRFNELLGDMSPEERQGCYYQAYALAMQHWGKCPKKYQRFFVDLVWHDWQGFLDYVLRETILK
ncbi:MAG: hypothetical protein LBQ65_10110 [Tannerellaceae bacterium]|jgi:hypothetical protein|nr:hypothetical protein [Tannerellaceae bacterium]